MVSLVAVLQRFARRGRVPRCRGGPALVVEAEGAGAGQLVPQLDQLTDRGHHGVAEDDVQQPEVQGDAGDGGGGLGDGSGVDRGHGPAAQGLAEAFVQPECGGFEMGLCGAGGALPVDRRGER